MSAPVLPACPHPQCHPDSNCALGERVEECPYFKKVAGASDGSLNPPVIGDGLPWTGSAMGIDDLAWLAVRERPFLVAPIGAHKAGKTTFLASLYIGLFRGQLPVGHEFIGSYTLGGWEKLAAYLRYAPDGVGPTFPPHTPVTENRMPGWLHIGFRGPSGVRDVLLADAPGEWFSRWAVKPDDDGGTGAAWLAARADAFLFFVDSAGLVGSERRTVIENLELLARRLATYSGERPVALIWAKADEEIRPNLRAEVTAALKDAFPKAEVFQTSIVSTTEAEPSRPFWRPLEWVLNHKPTFEPLVLAPPIDPCDPFLAFRG